MPNVFLAFLQCTCETGGGDYIHIVVSSVWEMACFWRLLLDLPVNGMTHIVKGLNYCACITSLPYLFPITTFSFPLLSIFLGYFIYETSLKCLMMERSRKIQRKRMASLVFSQGLANTFLLYYHPQHNLQAPSFFFCFFLMN